jgi:adenosylcobinamide-phosphate synthase
MQILLFGSAALIIAFILDAIIGDPQWFPHIVRIFGKEINLLEKLLYRINNKRFAGLILLMIMLIVNGGLTFLLLLFCYKISPWLYLLVESFLCWQCIALKSLKVESKQVYKALATKDLTEARFRLSRIVGRDTENLNTDGVTRAAVETVAENASDGVTAPLLYLFLFGGTGGVIYKTINTLDSMLGYKNEKYIDFGRASAKADDAINFLPSRLCALFMIFSAKILEYDSKNAWMIYKRDRFNHSSPNSAQTESAAAGALRLRLGGGAFYGGVFYDKLFIGDDIKQIEIEDIISSHKLLNMTAIITFVFGMLIRGVMYAIL